MSNETIIPVFYRTGEVAKFVGVSDRAVRTWVHTGVLKGTVVGGTVLVFRGPVDRLLAEAGAA